MSGCSIASWNKINVESFHMDKQQIPIFHLLFVVPGIDWILIDGIFNRSFATILNSLYLDRVNMSKKIRKIGIRVLTWPKTGAILRKD